MLGIVVSFLIPEWLLARSGPQPAGTDDEDASRPFGEMTYRKIGHQWAADVIDNT
jgi:hypothetical protein